ncbi:MAG: GNAT family N-acetyltransferase [Treponema sp.]|jgi:Leu/Phe-tRNA-protein transferase|nr:GNAT family N-acetyltransferase [Treponema sp.]
MLLRYTSAGFLIIKPEDNCHAIVDAMLATGYNEEFCIALDFDPEFTARLMDAGFLVMSADIAEIDEEEPFYISMPKLHLERSALFFENLHIKKSVKRLLNKYELKVDTDFNFLIDRCIEKHGSGWLTPPLVECIKEIRRTRPTGNAYPTSFSLYRNGSLVAGEFGIICGKVYTSYSGYYDESNAGTVQLILLAKYLQEQGFLFFDLGMPINYKFDLGAVNITPEKFVSLFRAANPRHE